MEAVVLALQHQHSHYLTVPGLGWTCGNMLKSLSLGTVSQELCDDEDSEEVSKHLELVVNAEKIAAKFDDKTGNMKVAMEIRTRYSRELTKECAFNPSII
jgi:hypothetical protein